VERLLLEQLDAFGGLEHHPARLRDEVLSLTRSLNPKLRLAAYRTLARLRPEEVPLRELFHVVHDMALPDSERVAALRAWTRGPHPEVYVRLHVLAWNVDHPGWSVVMERLAELGDRFTIQRLSNLGFELDETRATIHRQTVARIRAELSTREGAGQVQALLERAAWADLQCHPLETELVRWTQETITAWTENESAVQVLMRLQRDYEPTPDVLSPMLGGIGDNYARRVRAYALRLLPD